MSLKVRIAGLVMAGASALFVILVLTRSGPQAGPAQSGEIGLAPGQIAPDFTTITVDGEAVSLADLRGSTVLLNFWATWCGPCRLEMPEFQRAYAQFAPRGFVVLAVNNSETADQITDFRAAFNLDFPLALDQAGEIQRQYAVFSYPSTWLLDPEGRILNRHFGPLTVDQIGDLLAQAGFSFDTDEQET
jgi:peroxiredoxin